MNSDIVTSSALTELAGSLARERDGILAKWRRDMAVAGEESLVKAVSRAEFYDAIPDFLECFCAVLRGDGRAIEMPARQHGAHRWQQGLDFEEVVLEWSLLHRILFERVNALWQTAGLGLASLQHVYWLLADAMQHAVGSSLVEFHEHQRLEADARRRDIEAILERRGVGLHQASHDLRGSLQIAQLSCSILKRRQHDQQTGVVVQRLSHALDGLNQIFNDLLELARLEAGREECCITDFDAAHLLRELCETMRPQAEARRLSLRVDGIDSLPVRNDAAKLRRIAQNLILNALGYTLTGSVEVGWQDESSTHWSFHVRDSGPGMPDSTAGSLAAGLEEASDGNVQTATGNADEATSFKPPATYGEGVGLAIVHRLCVLLNAVLEVDTESGQGTTFRVRMPR